MRTDNPIELALADPMWDMLLERKLMAEGKPTSKSGQASGAAQCVRLCNRASQLAVSKSHTVNQNGLQATPGFEIVF